MKLITRTGLAFVIVILGNPASPEDSSSSTVPGKARYASGPFAPFPLTLTLSLREREQRASRSESRKFWIVLRGGKGSPSPQGRGLG
jgi:hypothetical protein